MSHHVITCQFLHYLPPRTCHFKPSNYEIFKACGSGHAHFLPFLENYTPASRTFWLYSLKVNKPNLSEIPYKLIFESVIKYINYSIKYNADSVHSSFILIFNHQILKLYKGQVPATKVLPPCQEPYPLCQGIPGATPERDLSQSVTYLARVT